MTSFYDSFFRKKHWSYLVLLLTPFFLYKKSLGFGFSPMDEQWIIIDNAWFLSDWSNLKEVFSGPTALLVYYRPLFVTSTMLDYHLGKLEPFIYHLTTLLWHLGCVILLFKFLLEYKTDIRLAFFMALIFAVHPIMLHAVAWIPGRNDSMLCFFMLASIISLNNYIDRNKIKYLLLHILFFTAALLTKENAVVFPIIYFVVIYLRKKKDMRLLLTSGTVSLILLAGFFILRKTFVGSIEIPDSSFAVTAKKSTLAFFLYFGKILFPFQQSVYPVLKHASVIPGIITLILFVVLWWKFRPEDKSSALLGCLVFFILLIVPLIFSAMKSSGEHYEHRLYAPMTGLFLFLSKLRFNIKSSIFTFALIGIPCLFMLVTLKRMNVYMNQLTFLNAGISSNPENYYFYLEKGQLLNKEEKYEMAVQSFNEALARNPNSGQAYFDRGNAYLYLRDKQHALSDYDSAFVHYKESMRRTVVLQRCMAFNFCNEPILAMKGLQTLKTCCPELVDPTLEKEITRKFETAQWNNKIWKSPKDAKLYVMRGMFFIKQGMAKEAMADLKKATELEPGNVQYREYYRRASNDLASAL